MRRFFYLCGCLFLLFPSVLMAGGDDSILAKVSRAITEKKWDEAGSFFKDAVKANKEDAENFFWRERVDDSFRKTMAMDLGNYYRKCHNHEKAYCFFSELVKLDPGNIDYLSSFAELEICCGKEKDALGTYEKILSQDINNLPANIYIGNYYFYYAEKTKLRLDETFSKLQAPTRMQYAVYRDKLANLLNKEYAKSKEYLNRVIASFPSTEVQKTLDKIKLVEAEINR